MKSFESCLSNVSHKSFPKIFWMNVKFLPKSTCVGRNFFLQCFFFDEWSFLLLLVKCVPHVGVLIVEREFTMKTHLGTGNYVCITDLPLSWIFHLRLPLLSFIEVFADVSFHVRKIFISSFPPTAWSVSVCANMIFNSLCNANHMKRLIKHLAEGQSVFDKVRLQPNEF